MPLIQERTFRVRNYECDAYGHVNHANYLRYMQEAALDASAAAGYDVARYEEIGRTWLIRETNINYLRPLVYGDSVIIKTWVADFRRVRSRRMYELRHAVTGEPVADAHTDWVYLDTETGRPVTVPPELITAFVPEGMTETAQPREPFPAMGEPPPGAFYMTQRVEWSDLDQAHHVNNAVYMTYIENAGVHVAEAHGWPMTRMMEHGFGLVARQYRIEYKVSAVLEDEVRLATWIVDVRRSSAVRVFTLTRVSDGVLLARARVLWVWVDLATGRPIRIPEGFVDAFADNIALENDQGC